MNKYQKELLDKCKKIEWRPAIEYPLFDYIYVLPTTRKHDSGYKIMLVIGYVEETDEYFLIDSGADVIDFEDWISKKPIRDIHIDIEHNGIIRYFSHWHKFRLLFDVSSCVFTVEDRK